MTELSQHDFTFCPRHDIYRGERDIERRVRRLSTMGTTAARRGTTAAAAAAVRGPINAVC